MIQKLIENGLPSQVAHSKTLKLKNLFQQYTVPMLIPHNR